MTGTLKARVSGAWVPILGGGPQSGSLGIVASGSMLNGSPTNIAATVYGPISTPLSCYTATGRRYRIAFSVRAVQTSDSSSRSFQYRYTKDGAGNYFGQRFSFIPGLYPHLHDEWILDGDGATHTFAIEAGGCAVGLGVYTENASSHFYVEDMGPSVAPALAVPATPPAWTPCSLTNGWKNNAAEQAAQYRKIGDVVTLRGPIDGGSLQGVAFTLPAGFRPPVRVHHSTGSWSGSAWVIARGLMDPDGTYRPWDGGLLSHALDGLSFSTTA